MILFHGIGFSIGSPITCTVCPGPNPGPTDAILSVYVRDIYQAQVL